MFIHVLVPRVYSTSRIKMYNFTENACFSWHVLYQLYCIHVYIKEGPLSLPLPCLRGSSIEVLAPRDVPRSSIRVELSGAVGTLFVVRIFWGGWGSDISNVAPSFLSLSTFLRITEGLDETLPLFSPIRILFLEFNDGTKFSILLFCLFSSLYDSKGMAILMGMKTWCRLY